jgi:hypothetical protein
LGFGDRLFRWNALATPVPTFPVTWIRGCWRKRTRLHKGPADYDVLSSIRNPFRVVRVGQLVPTFFLVHSSGVLALFSLLQAGGREPNQTHAIFCRRNQAFAPFSVFTGLNCFRFVFLLSFHLTVYLRAFPGMWFAALEIQLWTRYLRAIRAFLLRQLSARAVIIRWYLCVFICFCGCNFLFALHFGDLMFGK